MLHITIHGGPLEKASRFNCTAWVDIGYARLAPVADYKVCLFHSGVGAKPDVVLKNYPRWSGSLWDLIARGIAVALSPDPLNPVEDLSPVGLPSKPFAFANAMCVIVEHFSDKATARRRVLASAEIFREGRARGVYRARFKEDTQLPHTTDTFLFRPKILNHAELVLRAALVHLTGQLDHLPPRPALSVPEALVEGGMRFVPLHQLPEPARSGFARWLARYSEAPLKRPGAPLGIAPETLYAKFLQEAV